MSARVQFALVFAGVAVALWMLGHGTSARTDSSSVSSPQVVSSPASSATPDVSGEAKGASLPAGRRKAAVRFLSAYLARAYGQRAGGRYRAATAFLAARLRASPPRPTPAMRNLKLRFRVLPAEGANAVALVSDGRTRYSVALTLVFRRGRWLVADVGGG